MLVMLDYAYQPAVLPPCDIIAGYLDSPGAVHPWTPEMWAVAKAHAKGRVPIYCAVSGADAIAGAHYAGEAVNQSRGLAVTEGDVIVFNVEHFQAQEVMDSGQGHAFVGGIAAAGFTPVTYGSMTDKELLSPLGKFWGAEWDDNANLPPGCVMHQYQGGQGHPYDVSVVDPSLPIAGLDTHNGGNPVPGNSPTVGFANTPSGNGYWEITEDGHIYSFGDAEYLHSPEDPHFNHLPIKTMVGHPKKQGYWIIAVDGSIYAYGAAAYHGSFTNGQLHPGH